jgi:type IV pilus secretin PilQ/predicted competence protein
MKKMIAKWFVLILCFFVLSFAATSKNGQRLYDFTFVNTDIRAVFQALAVTSGVDILAAPNVQYDVTVRVNQKSWQEVLTIVCKMHALTWHIEENYVYVEREADFEQRKQDEAVKQNALEQMAPLIRRHFQIKHAKATDLVPLLDKLKSRRGTVQPIERNNAIIVLDVQERLEQMEKSLQELDKETKQIMISAKLVVVNQEFTKEMGVDWSAEAGYGGILSANTSADVINSDQLGNSRARAAVSSDPSDMAARHFSISTGVLDNNLGVRLQALFSETNSELLASPQISTLDHTEAEIFMGEKVSLRVIDAQGQAANQIVEAGIRLKVTPHVTGENRIMLELAPENNSYQLDENGQVIINTQEANTVVVIGDGETLVIGGLARNIESEIENGIPFLKDIPLFGNLFKYQRKQITKQDLMIFVTPRIMRNAIQATGLVQQEAVQQQIQQADVAQEYVESTTEATPEGESVGTSQQTSQPKPQSFEQAPKAQATPQSTPTNTESEADDWGSDQSSDGWN